MITIQSVMLVMLGLLSALLAFAVFLPAYRRRIERLTDERIRRSMPVTEAEIRADKDRLRAQFAIRVHKLESQVEQAKLSAARQQVELNRRDASIATLESNLSAAQAQLEELINAKRVLEHTVTDRLPHVEQRLKDAHALIGKREEDIAVMNSEAARTVRALDEAMQINAQQRSEIERINAAMRSRATPNREMLADPRFEGEVALKSELEALWAKTRDQASLISRLQMAGAGSGGHAFDTGSGKAAEAPAVTRDVADLKAKIEDQATEIARLTAELKSLQAPDGGDSRIANKARLASLQAQTGAQGETIQRLRAELAAANERLARQAQHFMDEMRRIGVGTLPASGPRRTGPGAAVRPDRTRTGRPTLSERISQANKPQLTIAASTAEDTDGTETAKVSELVGAGGDGDQAPPTQPDRAAETAGGEPVAGHGGQKSRLLDRIGAVRKS